MRPALTPLSVWLLASLTACGARPEAANNAMAAGTLEDGSGRYSGIGTYPSDSLWNDIQGAEATNDAQAAKLGDDSQVIVVVDRYSGEVRQCGNRSGFCIAMNPWKGKGREAAPQLPVQIDRHVPEQSNMASNAAEAEPVKKGK